MTKFEFEQIQSFSNEKGEQTGLFRLDNLRPGLGITVGNALRRTLLSDLEGTAITYVKIYGVNYEYGIIAGMREDVLDLLLNLKAIKFRGKVPQVYSTVLEIKGPSLVTAADIPLSSDLAVINKSAYIASVSEQTCLRLEFKIETKPGYKNIKSETNPYTENTPFLPVESNFGPITRVEYHVDHQIGGIARSACDNLEFEITTNGSLTPDEALLSSANILKKLFESLTIREPEVLHLSDVKTEREILIEELKLSVRAYNCLKRLNIRTINDLTKYSIKELKKIKNFGLKSLTEVVQKLKDKFDIDLK